MVRIGVIGCGAIHSTHCDAIREVEGAVLAAVCDEVPEKAKAAGEKYDVPALSRLRDLWQHVDAVTVAVPSGLHARVGIAAAKAGKHVLAEKPVDITLKKATALLDACRSAGVKLGVVSQHRFAGDLQRLHDAAQGGELGKLILGDAYVKWYRTQAYYDSGDWRGTWSLDGGGCLMNQGVHYVDMIQWIMGGVRAVQAQVRTASHDIEVEDVAAALIEYKNGAIGVIQGSTSVYPGLAERLEVHGTAGTVIAEADRIKLWETNPEEDGSKYGRGVQSQPVPNVHTHEPEESAGTGASDPSAIWGEQHRLQIEDFVRAILDNREPAMTGEMALEPLKIILAIYKSSRQGGRRVEV